MDTKNEKANQYKSDINTCSKDLIRDNAGDSDKDLQITRMPSQPILLENRWCIWHHRYQPGQTAEHYENSLKNLGSFTDVGEFWSYFNNLPNFEKLTERSSFHIMKTGVKPIWEDPENINGGSWQLRVSKSETQKAWTDTVLAVIGEQFDCALSEGDDICGVSLNIKRSDNTLEIWNKVDSVNKDEILTRLINLVPCVDSEKAFYKGHREHDGFNVITRKPTSSNSHRSDASSRRSLENTMSKRPPTAFFRGSASQSPQRSSDEDKNSDRKI